MAVLDGTIVNVGLPKIMAVFNTNPSKIQWIVTAYMLTLGVSMPVSGFLGDRYGYKRMYLLALALFVAGSALCGMAWNVESLIIARIIQGLGGGIMQPIGMAILYQNYPRSRMGMVLGFWGIAAMLAPAIGPTLGGYLVDNATWRLVFYINLPIGALALLLGVMILKETELQKRSEFDTIGLVTSTTGFATLLLALSQGNDHGWTSPYILSLLFLATFSLTVMAINELTHPDPVLDLRLFTNYTFTLALIIGCIISIGMFGVIFLMPMLLQSVLGQSATQTGLIMFPAALASGIMMPLSGRLFDRYGPKVVAVPGLAIIVYTTYMMHVFDANTPFIVMTWWLVFRGFGMGMSFMPINTAGMNAVPPHLTGKASALSNVIRQVASAFGIAVFTSIMQNRQVFHYANLAQSVNPALGQDLAFWSQIGSYVTTSGFSPNITFGLGTSILMQKIAKSSMVFAIDDCFIVSALLCFVAFILSFFLDKPKTQHTA